MAVDFVSRMNREGGPVVLTGLETKLAKKFAKVALFEGIRLDVKPMTSYYDPPELTPRRIAFEDVNLIIKSEATNEPDLPFPVWDLRFLRLGRVNPERKPEEVSAQGVPWSLKLEDVKEMVAELSTPTHRIFLLPSKILYQHLAAPEPNSAKNFHSTLNQILDAAPACEADEDTRDWCECRRSQIPIYQSMASFKRESLGELQQIMA
jgi:hypothetical protein